MHACVKYLEQWLARGKGSVSYFIYIYIYIYTFFFFWLHRVLVAARRIFVATCRIFSCSMQDL